MNWLKKIVLIILSLCLLILITESNGQTQDESFVSNKTTRVICIGDSILNNARYVGNNESVLDQLNKLDLEKLYTFNMLARDGAKLNDAFRQLDLYTNQNDNNAKIVIVSIGGNDLLAEDEEPRELFQQYLKLMKTIRSRVSDDVRIFSLGLYYPLSKKRFLNRIKQWNAWLNENADSNGYMVLNIETVITGQSDICYKIEPSAKGAKKIAELILNSL